MKYKYILFDMDGTLIESSPGITRCVADTLKEFGIDKKPEEYLNFIGPPFIVSARNILHFEEEKAMQATKLYREYFSKEEYLYDIKLFDGVIDMLETLKQRGALLFIATCRPKPFAQAIVDHYNLNKYFEIVGGLPIDTIGGEKADVIHEIFKNYPTSRKEEYVMVGDRDQDMIGAKKAGIDAIGLRMGFAAPGELEAYSPVYIADNISALKAFLLS